MLSFPDIDHLFRWACKEVLTNGDEVVTRGLKSKEIIGLQLRLLDSSRCVLTSRGRKASETFMAAEWLWVASGREDVGFISQFSQKIAQFSDDQVMFYGAYGPRWLAQLPELLSRLKKDLNTRQAVVTFWRPSPIETKDIPCTIGLHFLYRYEQLNLISWMRSNDLWLGLPYDTFTFCQLLNLVAAELHIKRGWYQLTVDSLHLYQPDWSQAGKLNPVITGKLVQTPDIDLGNQSLIEVLVKVRLQLDNFQINIPKLCGINGLGQYIELLKKRCTLKPLNSNIIIEQA